MIYHPQSHVAILAIEAIAINKHTKISYSCRRLHFNVGEIGIMRMIDNKQNVPSKLHNISGNDKCYDVTWSLYLSLYHKVLSHIRMQKKDTSLC